MTATLSSLLPPVQSLLSALPALIAASCSRTSLLPTSSTSWGFCMVVPQGQCQPLLISILTSPLRLLFSNIYLILLFPSLSPPVLLSSPLPLFSHSALPLPSYFPLHFSPFLPLHLRSWHIPPGEAEGLYSLLVALGVTTVNLEPVIPPGGGDTLPGTIENTLFKTITPLQLKRPKILVWGGPVLHPPPSILTGELRSKNNLLKWQN